MQNLMIPDNSDMGFLSHRESKVHGNPLQKKDKLIKEILKTTKQGAVMDYKAFCNLMDKKK